MNSTSKAREWPVGLNDMPSSETNAYGISYDIGERISKGRDLRVSSAVGIYLVNLCRM